MVGLSKMRHSYLSTIDGDDYNKMTRSLIQRTVSKDFALQYWRKGRQGKKNFSDTRLYAAVFGRYVHLHFTAYCC